MPLSMAGMRLDTRVSPTPENPGIMRQIRDLNGALNHYRNRVTAFACTADYHSVVLAELSGRLSRAFRWLQE